LNQFVRPLPDDPTAYPSTGNDQHREQTSGTSAPGSAGRGSLPAANLWSWICRRQRRGIAVSVNIYIYIQIQYTSIPDFFT
jgi:hypothetical protein